MAWTTDDSYRIVIEKKGVPTARGTLRNPDFPDAVSPCDEWSGSITAVNAGEETGTFRFRIDGRTTDTFSLDPGQSRSLSLSGHQEAYPTAFVINLDRKTPDTWVEDDDYGVYIRPL